MVKFERVKGETTKPLALLRVMQAIGPTRAARELGVSQTTLYKAQREHVVSKVYEIAAAGWEQRNPDKAATAETARESVPRELERAAPPVPPRPVAIAATDAKKLVMMDVPADKVDLIKRVVEQLGGEIVT